jgi:dihydroflavonol-4-reductase
MKTLVTGGAGFIGSHVVRALADRGDDLRLTMRDSTKDENLAGLEYESVKCDLRDRRQVRRALRDVDRTFHCAGMTSLRASDAERLFEVNVVGTRNLLEECLRADVERVVYTSSVAAIGPAPVGGRADENQLFTAGKLGIP